MTSVIIFIIIGMTGAYFIGRSDGYVSAVNKLANGNLTLEIWAKAENIHYKTFSIENKKDESSSPT